MTREEIKKGLISYLDSIKWGIGEYHEVFGSLINMLSLPEKDEWISVSERERLPEQYKEVIVTDIETSDTYLSRYIGNGYWECDNGLFKNRIIAWQPKPKPYKAEKGCKE